MIKIEEIAYSAYPVTDMARARRFYEGILGLTPGLEGGGEDGGPCWVEYEIAGGVLAIANIEPSWKPTADGASVALEVEDLDAALAHLRENGVPILRDDIESPVCRMAIISDPDGSNIIIHKRKSFSTPPA